MSRIRTLHRGKRALSAKIFGTDAHWRSIPNLIGALPIFELAGIYCAYDDEIDEALDALKASAKRPPPRVSRRAEATNR